MVILLDIGNTAVSHAIFSHARLHSFGSSLINDIPKLILKWSKSRDINGYDIVISSVVPRNTYMLRKYLSNRRAFRLWEAGRNLPLNIRSRYRKPNKLGMDRRVNIYGALKLYPSPLLIIDYGTAVTFDYVSRYGIFEGGMIIPGPELSLQALIERAALLPKKIRLPRKSAPFIGRSTLECLTSGILQGYGALTEELVARFKRRCGRRLFVLATGGFSTHLKPFTHSYNLLDPTHTLKSLLLLFKNKA